MVPIALPSWFRTDFERVAGIRSIWGPKTKTKANGAKMLEPSGRCSKRSCVGLISKFTNTAVVNGRIEGRISGRVGVVEYWAAESLSLLDHLQVFVNGVGGNICSILAEPSSSIRDVREVLLAFLASEVLHGTKVMTIYERWK